MSLATATPREHCRALFGNPVAPIDVWEREFDHDDAALHALAKKDWWDINADELRRYYLLNLVHVEPLQPEVFRYLFPLCLAYWQEALMDDSGPAFDNWHDVMRRTCLFETMMTPPQAQAVKTFITDGLLARLDRERGFLYDGSRTPAYTWQFEINELGGSLPLVARLWDRWWAVDSPGKAVSAIMYASGLIYEEGENPIFGAWTREHGGGGPYLSDAGASADWSADNLQALRERLTVERLLTLVDLSAQRLRQEPEFALAMRIAVDARDRTSIIEIQIDALLESLATQSQSCWP
ncbi:hypothetical protein [Achromobacter sp. NCFB-sbj8-Ac1-l]|uniref:hypothetical protein n=1 Tax=unclassified Achromobacter TaxID=2626865 RepID=UPI004046AC2D